MEEGVFDFNLLPQKSKKILKEEKQRDESTFYSVILLFSGIIIFLILSLLDIFFVQSRIDAANATLQDYDEVIASYNDVRAKNGELFVKGERLSPVLESDIRLNDFLEVANEITGGIDIVNYAREDSDAFIITFYVDSATDALSIWTAASEIEDVKDPFIREITRDSGRDNRLKVILEFNLISDEEDLL